MYNIKTKSRDYTSVIVALLFLTLAGLNVFTLYQLKVIQNDPCSKIFVQTMVSNGQQGVPALASICLVKPAQPQPQQNYRMKQRDMEA